MVLARHDREPDAAAQLDDLLRAAEDTDCPHCRAPVCDCHRPGRAAGHPDREED